ncbi:DoxX family protein [Sediminibacterium goheungense]|uniref:DoxX-like protein n=1 Tax=Sediminibacterium goheungense TaxID=1086393 RepID=A0A4R6J2U8_9BACT|nr:DoxX family protein [Sediminibacterium goheungense]TDO29111.1 DoxX-like protein [Sediminibacterium goheungense]
MKKTKLIYWITTILFSGFMIFSAIPNIMLNAESKQFLTGYLGYPEYFIPFIGVAKLLGSLAILVPSFKKIKEWAYAGLAFDLIGAMYSVIKVGGIDPGMSIMLLVFAAGITSYLLNEKVNNLK